jgi:hypothetical protein
LIPRNWTAATAHTFGVTCAADAWFQRIQSYKTGFAHIYCDDCHHMTIQYNDFVDVWDYGDNGMGYGVVMGKYSTYNLIENNVVGTIYVKLLGYSPVKDCADMLIWSTMVPVEM